MSSGNATWIGRKGRTPKESAAKVTVASTVTKQAPYGSSHLFAELNSIVQIFSPEQREIAASTGFRCFAKPCHEIQFDRQFTSWLMLKVDTMQRSISAGTGKRLMIFQEDAGKVIGIPCSGKEVWSATLDKSQANKKKIERMIGMDKDNTSPRLAAARTLRSLAGRKMTAEEAVVFKVAFTVFVVSMLCDSMNHGEQESTNYWPALANPDAIHSLNWASYFVDAVLSACAAAKMASRRNVPYSPPAGTTLFLTIFYLDNMDYGPISLLKGARPSLELFDAQTLSKHIIAETIGLNGQTPCKMFGAGKARRDTEVVYKRSVMTVAGSAKAIAPSVQQPKRTRSEIPCKSTVGPPPLDTNTQLLLAAKAHKARCLKILALARKSIEEESDKLVDTFTKIKMAHQPLLTVHTDKVRGQQATAIDASPGEPAPTPSPTLPGIRDHTATMEQHQRMKACDPPTFSLGTEFDEPAPSGPSNKPAHPNTAYTLTPVSPLGPSPPRKTMRHSSPTSPLAANIIRSGEYLFNKRSSAQINLNDEATEFEFTQSPIIRKHVSEGRIYLPPRDTSRHSSAMKVEAANVFYKWAIGSIGDPNRFWVRHGSPKFIELSSKDIIEQFGTSGFFSPDTCDALLRIFQQPPDNGTLIEWRHFLETDFAMRVIAGEDFISSRSIQHQWIGKHIQIDGSKCMLIITLVMVEDTWAAYAWDMKRRQLTIHAPGNTTNEWEAYDKIVSLLNCTIQRCISAFFEGWSVDWHNWATVYTTATSLSKTLPDGYDFGPEALQFCQTFDGGKLTMPKEDCATPAELLYELLHLKNNTGNLPSEFVQDLE